MIGAVPSPLIVGYESMTPEQQTETSNDDTKRQHEVECHRRIRRVVVLRPQGELCHIAFRLRPASAITGTNKPMKWP
jgi:hypothetical protein